MPVDLVLLGFAFTMGLLTFFSPCSVALVPAYVGAYVGLDAAGERAGPRGAAMAGARFGAAAASGILALFTVAGALIYILRTQFALPSDVLAGTLSWLAIAVGLVLVVLGVLLLAGAAPGVTLPLRAPQTKTVRGMALFGVVFAVASLGCTLPLFFGVLAAALGQSVLGGLLTFVAFGMGIAVLMFAMSLALAVAKERAHALVRRAAGYVRPVSGVVMILAGAYVLWYYLTLPGLG